MKYTCLAQRFAAKEAVAKAIGTGFGRYFYFNEVSIENLENGKPSIVLSGKAKKYCENSNINSFEISLSGTDNNAIAFVIALT